MALPSSQQMEFIRRRASALPHAAVELVRLALVATAHTTHGAPGPGELQAARSGAVPVTRHISGQQLCWGIRDAAIARYGRLAPVVMRRWGVRGTEDFGAIVYWLIESGEMRANASDQFEDFINVYDIEETFGATETVGKA